LAGGFTVRQPPQVWCHIRDRVVVFEESSMVRGSATQSYRAGGAGHGFTLIELLVVVAIIGLLLGLLFPAVQAVREKTRGNSCSGNLRQLALAMHTYHNFNGRLPMGAVCKPHPLPISHGHTWVEYLFPFINQQAVYDKIDFLAFNHEAPNPAALNNLLIPSLLCPSDPKAGLFDNGRWLALYTPGPAGTRSMGQSYSPSGGPLQMNGCPIPPGNPNINCLSERGGARRADGSSRGAPGMFAGGPVAYGFDHCTDGLSNTFLIGETLPEYSDFAMYFVSHLNVASTNMPPNMAAAAYPACKNGSAYVAIKNDCYIVASGFNSRHPGGVQVMMADGSSRWVGDGIEYSLYQYLGNRKDGQIASLDGQ